MRSIPNSGYCLSLIFCDLCPLSLICLFVLCRPRLCVVFISEEELHLTQDVNLRQILCCFVSFCLSVCLPPLSLVLGFIPGYFHTRMSYPCWEYVSLLLHLTPSSSHTGCLTAPCTTCCMKAPVSISTLVTKSVLVTSFWWFAGICDIFALCHFVAITFSAAAIHCRTVLW